MRLSAIVPCLGLVLALGAGLAVAPSAVVAQGQDTGIVERLRRSQQPIPNLQREETVALLAANGKFVAAENGGGGPLVANRTHIRGWERLDILHLGGNLVALRVNNGRFVTARPDGALRAGARRINQRQTFRLISLGGALHAFQTHDGRFIAIRPRRGGELTADATALRNRAIFAVAQLAGGGGR
ncbi:MAG: hypothetical protein ACFCBW_20980 [Candidatus Competibacterales bacterium]